MIGDGRRLVAAIGGIEAAQLRALAGALERVDDEARVNLSMTDDGFLHAEVDDPVGRRTCVTITDTSAVITSIAPPR